MQPPNEILEAARAWRDSGERDLRDLCDFILNLPRDEAAPPLHEIATKLREYAKKYFDYSRKLLSEGDYNAEFPAADAYLLLTCAHMLDRKHMPAAYGVKLQSGRVLRVHQTEGEAERSCNRSLEPDTHEIPVRLYALVEEGDEPNAFR